ncbi:hypothetical protein Tco_1450652, partial [Tanacetum coccineum]
ILLDIEQLIHGFLWCNGELKREKAKVAWKDICLLKSKGGLGIRSLISGQRLEMAVMSNLIANMEDTQCWCNPNGVLSKFSVKATWEAFRPRGNVIPWYGPLFDILRGMDVVPARLEDIVLILQPIAHWKALIGCVCILYMN